MPYRLGPSGKGHPFCEHVGPHRGGGQQVGGGDRWQYDSNFFSFLFCQSYEYFRPKLFHPKCVRPACLLTINAHLFKHCLPDQGYCFGWPTHPRQGKPHQGLLKTLDCIR